MKAPSLIRGVPVGGCLLWVVDDSQCVNERIGRLGQKGDAPRRERLWRVQAPSLRQPLDPCRGGAHKREPEHGPGAGERVCQPLQCLKRTRHVVPVGALAQSLRQANYPAKVASRAQAESAFGILPSPEPTRGRVRSPRYDVFSRR